MIDRPEFDDGKAPDALRTIGEVSKALGIRQHVLRYWEEQFLALKPVKRSGGRRYYRPEEVQLIVTINRLVHHEGYTLRGARLTISGKSNPPNQASATLAPAELVGGTGLAERLQSIRRDLASALDAA